MKCSYSICRFIFLMLFICFVLPGCATIFHGSTEEVDINSVPRGAQVYINDENKGTAPVKLTLSPKLPYSIEFRKEGYKNKTVNLTSSVGMTWIILDFFGSLPAFIVDASTKDWYTFDQQHLVGVLEKDQTLADKKEPPAANMKKPDEIMLHEKKISDNNKPVENKAAAENRQLTPVADKSNEFIIADKPFAAVGGGFGTDVDIVEVTGESFKVKGGRGLAIGNGEINLWCDGAKHTWIGKLTYSGYQFDSDETDPMTFQVVKDKGYLYLKGKGKLTYPDGKIFSLPVATAEK